MLITVKKEINILDLDESPNQAEYLDIIGHGLERRIYIQGPYNMVKLPSWLRGLFTITYGYDIKDSDDKLSVIVTAYADVQPKIKWLARFFEGEEIEWQM